MRFKKGQQVIVCDNGELYSTHSRGKELAGKLYDYMGEIPDGSSVTILKCNPNHEDGSYGVLYNGKHYLIGQNGLSEKMFTQQQMIDFAQHLLKDFSTQEVTLSYLNDFLNIK